MMEVSSIDRNAARELIIEMHGGLIADDAAMFALRACTAHASHTWVCTVDDHPVAAWGLVPPTFMSDRAYLWLYSTPAVDHYKFAFVRRSQIVMAEMRKLYPHIYGVCKIGDDRAHRWLRWLGAKFGQPNSMPGFIPFSIETPNG